MPMPVRGGSTARTGLATQAATSSRQNMSLAFMVNLRLMVRMVVGSEARESAVERADRLRPWVLPAAVAERDGERVVVVMDRVAEMQVPAPAFGMLKRS